MASPLPDSLASRRGSSARSWPPTCVWAAVSSGAIGSAGSALGLLAESAATLSAFVIGLTIKPVDPLAGPVAAQAAGFALLTLAIAPLAGRDVFRMGVGVALLALGCSLLGAAWSGPTPALEQLEMAALLVGIAGATSLLSPPLQAEPMTAAVRSRPRGWPGLLAARTRWPGPSRREGRPQPVRPDLRESLERARPEPAHPRPARPAEPVASEIPSRPKPAPGPASEPEPAHRKPMTADPLEPDIWAAWAARGARARVQIDRPRPSSARFEPGLAQEARAKETDHQISPEPARQAMTLIAFLLVCVLGMLLGLLAQPYARVSRAVSIGSLAAALAAALLMRPDDTVTVGEVQLGNDLVRRVLPDGAGRELPAAVRPRPAYRLAGTTGAGGSGGPGRGRDRHLVDRSNGRRGGGRRGHGPGRPGGQPDPVHAAGNDGRHRRDAHPGARDRGLACSPRQPSCNTNWNADDSTFVLALAFLVLAAAVAVRSGAVPFHVPAALLSRSGEGLGLVLSLVWIPTAFGLVALSWNATIYGVPGDWLDRAVVAVQLVAVATLILGAVGAVLHDEIEEIAAYSIVQDTGFLLLAMTARDADAAQAGRLWLLVFVIAKSALVAWVATASWAFETSNLGELRGWLRRTPLLGLALIAIVVATLGWPGSPVFEARATLVRLGLPDWVHFLGLAAMLLSLAYYGRLLAVGVLPPSARVRDAGADWPRWPRMLADDGTDDADGEDAAGGDEDDEARPRRLRFSVRHRAAAAWRLNRPLQASLLVLMTAGMAVVVAFGGLGAEQASQSGIALDQTTGQVPVPGAVDNGGAADARAHCRTDASAQRSPPPPNSPTPTPTAAPTPSQTPSPTPTAQPS